MKAPFHLSLALLAVCAGVRAAETSPAFTVPARPLSFELAAPLPPVLVTGMDVIAPDGRRLGPPLRLREDSVYTLQVAVNRTPHAGSQPLRIVVTLDSGGPLRETACPLEETSAEASRQPLELPLRLDPAQGAGESVLRIRAERKEGPSSGGVRSWPLAVFPAFVEPVPAPAVLDRGQVAKAFGDGAVLLDARFRLGKGACVEVPVPSEWSDVTFCAIGVVSSVAWLPRQDRNRLGLVLATVTASPAGESFPLRLGMETLQVDDAAFAESRALENAEVPVFSEWSAAKGGETSIRRNYAATCPLNSPHPLKSVTLSHAGAAAVVQVDGIVLLPGK